MDAVDITQLLQGLFRWMHVLAGIIWVGLLYFFNWVNAPFQATLEGDTKRKVNPELLPRALFWFRWGAAWTWATGVLLLLLVYYHGGNLFDGDSNWSGGAFLMIAVSFLFVFAYDAALKSSAALADLKTLFVVGLVAVAVVGALDQYVGGFGYRGMNIHLGTMFGTMMAFNVWFRIWPAQQQIITAVKEGRPPEAALVTLAGTRSKHNTYMSIPLVWTMIGQHTVVPWASRGWMGLVVMVAIGWWFGTMLFRQSAKIKGF